MPPQLTAESIEVEGRLLVEVFDAARRAWGEFRPPPSPCCEITLDLHGVRVQDLLCPEAASVWVWSRHLLRCAMEEAWLDLWLFVEEHGPVETEGGTYQINGDGNLAYRRPACTVPFYSRPSRN